MRAAYLPGGRRVELRSVADPTPGPTQVVVEMRASTICGSDLRAIYREHLGVGAEAYQDVIAGHEPCGQIVGVGRDVRERRIGDRVVAYHISGCGMCPDCRAGYQVSCSSPLRRAYGWQRDGGHADLLLAEERDLLALPEPLTFLDGACVACGFGTAYEAVTRAGLSGRDSVLVTGLGPVGLAVGILARALGSQHIIGSDPTPGRRALAQKLGAVDVALDASDATADAVRETTDGRGVDVAIDCSGAGAATAAAVDACARWGRCVLVGEGARVTLDVSPQLIHRHLTMIGSWVTSTVRMAELLDRLARWQLHPDQIVTACFPLEQVSEAYAAADRGEDGKVAVVMPE